MSIRNLRTLVAIHKYGSFNAAAEMLRLSQPAVSQQIKNLEKMWNKTLFDRSNRSPELNSIGKAIVNEAEIIIKAYDGILSSALGSENFEGEIVIGAVPTTLTGLLPMAMHLLKQNYPELKVIIHPSQSIRQMSQIERGSIDAGIIGKPDIFPHGLNFRSIADEPMLLLVPPDIKSKNPIELLQTLPFIRFDREALFGQMVEKWLQKNGLKVNETMELEGLEAISSMVFANLGVSIVPKSCVSSINPIPVQSLSLGANAPSRQLGLAYLNDNPKSHVIETFYAALTEAVAFGKLSVVT